MSDSTKREAPPERLTPWPGGLAECVNGILPIIVVGLTPKGVDFCDYSVNTRAVEQLTDEGFREFDRMVEAARQSVTMEARRRALA